ncbi:MAG: GntR family transcriptional regulator [Clostridiales bacterium]|nr:GntR family transcriptional regulator [Clostridiales bacterium]
MLRYDFEKRNGKPLYEYLYECLKKDILSGRLPVKTKLPSKRELARNNSVSVKTVMNAYDQLLVEGYIIEDDYDCEFRYGSRMIPTLQSTDKNHRIIYMNTFSKTLAPAIRISYMVLPEKLMQRYLDRATFYSNTASSCEQYALANFIRQGYFERQISRLKKHYHERGELLLGIIQNAEKMPVKKITGDDSGTHLLVYLDTELPDTVLK